MLGLVLFVACVNVAQLRLAQAESRAADAQATLVRTMEEESARLVAKFQTLPDRAIASLADFIVLEATGLGPGKPQ